MPDCRIPLDKELVSNVRRFGLGGGFFTIFQLMEYNHTTSIITASTLINITPFQIERITRNSSVLSFFLYESVSDFYHYSFNFTYSISDCSLKILPNAEMIINAPLHIASIETNRIHSSKA